MTEEREPLQDRQELPPSYTAPMDPDADTGAMEAGEDDRADAERLGEDVQQTLNRH
jgi:hypothetical protein